MGKHTVKTDQSGKVKVRIIEFELEGSDMSLQESLKSISAALTKSPVLATSRQSHRLGVGKSSMEVPDGTTEVIDEIESLEEISSTAETEVAASATSKKIRKPQRVATPNLVSVRFDDGELPFAEFVARKDPKNDMQKYLCAAFWLKTYKSILEVSVDHMYTAYKVMNWALPAVPVQPMRELAATRDKRFSKGAEKGHYAINHVGEGFVATKMGTGQ